MTAECRPPPDTPTGTICWLYYDRPDGGRDWCALTWHAPDVWAGIYDAGANRAARFGWRFHSVAKVPTSSPAEIPQPPPPQRRQG